MSDDVHKCHRGHVKVRRRYGWYCAPCEVINRHAREEKAFLEGRRTRRVGRRTWHSKSTPTDEKCKRGHPRVMRPSGRLACPTCQNAHKAARRKLEQSKTCCHIDEPGFEGVVNKQGTMVCLQCLVEQTKAS